MSHVHKFVYEYIIIFELVCYTNEYKQVFSLSQTLSIHKQLGSFIVLYK